MRRAAAALCAALLIAASAAFAGGTLPTLGAGPGAASAGACADPSWSSVVLLVGNDNAANGSTTFTDQSASVHSLTANGAVVYSNSTAPTGLSTSISFPSAWLGTPDSADWAFGAGDFTLEVYVNYTATAGDAALLTQWFTSTSFIMDTSGNTLRLVTSDSGGAQQNVTAAWTPATATWFHVAATRSGNNGFIFVNGVQQATASITQTLRDSNVQLEIGALNNGTTNKLNGFMAAIRITKGVARYTGNFTPPALPLPHC